MKGEKGRDRNEDTALTSLKHVFKIQFIKCLICRLRSPWCGWGGHARRTSRAGRQGTGSLLAPPTPCSDARGARMHPGGHMAENRTPEASRVSAYRGGWGSPAGPSLSRASPGGASRGWRGWAGRGGGPGRAEGSRSGVASCLQVGSTLTEWAEKGGSPGPDPQLLWL